MMIYKYREFIFWQSEQQFKIQSHFVIFDPVIGEGKWYDDTASHAIKCICELCGNVWLLYSMKSLLDLCKIIVDEELIYNLSSLSDCDILNLLRSDWSYMSLIQVLHSHVILFLLLIGLIYFGMYFLSDVSPIHNFP